VHSRGIRIIGALEWLLPLDSGPWQARWSLQEDYGTLFDLLRRGQIRTTGLVTDVVPPSRAQETYSRLADREPGMGAVLFDWRAGS
jgi:threonine dehydrogenase-like Zn-dependent dehydrogenase